MTLLVIASAVILVLRTGTTCAGPAPTPPHQRGRSSGGVSVSRKRYRPNDAFLAKAQIEQQEEADDDANGDPASSLRHFNRQLRRIRRGEPVDTLIGVWSEPRGVDRPVIRDRPAAGGVRCMQCHLHW